ncbi:TetR/AcrR family transcriptional regulator [Streptomyces sp. NBC_00237]|uniref:TetR/AcrR family transcriptional regulator n=1 Tax=Streptomyces sp. NBC_00237 TaxID=2975687 RepID=UPI00225AB413|nr:TetR/AcrR family transcriptional regulator [Streptomyces sp. NBC_00237]MCX5206717.1 TetR/AcrR family transcriptional regulator [Streptomyces sp. NBC_00237]
MARPRAFDENAVLEAAAAQFRVHGYADTSTEQLCEAAGLRRSSLYNAFTSKDELFVQALEHYAATMCGRQASILTDTSLTGAERIQKLIGAIVDEERVARSEGRAAGCMGVHALMNPDLRARDERIARILDRDLRKRLDLLEGAIRAGRIDGSVPEGPDAGEGALLINTLIAGLRVTAQSGITPETLHRIALDGLRSLLA